MGHGQGAGPQWAGSVSSGCGKPKGQPAVQPDSRVALRERMDPDSEGEL